MKVSAKNVEVNGKYTLPSKLLVMIMNVIVLGNLLKFVIFLFQDYCTVLVWRTSLNYNIAVHFFLIFKANQKGLFVENNVSGKAQFCVQEGLKKTAGKKYASTHVESQMLSNTAILKVSLFGWNAITIVCLHILFLIIWCMFKQKNTGQAYFLSGLGKVYRINPIT